MIFVLIHIYYVKTTATLKKNVQYYFCSIESRISSKIDIKGECHN